MQKYTIIPVDATKPKDTILTELYGCLSFGFNNFKNYMLTHPDIMSSKDLLLKFNSLTPETILTLWAHPSNTSENEVEYILNEFAQCNRDPSTFYHSSLVNPEQKLIAEHFATDVPTLFRFASFFHYLKYMLGAYHIKELTGDDNTVQSWKNNTGITFFFALSTAHQLTLVTNYNKSYENL